MPFYCTFENLSALCGIRERERNGLCNIVSDEDIKKQDIKKHKERVVKQHVSNVVSSNLTDGFLCANVTLLGDQCFSPRAHMCKGLMAL